MGKEGLEPSRVTAHDPKSCLSANSSTSPRKIDYMRVAIPRQIIAQSCSNFANCGIGLVDLVEDCVSLDSRGWKVATEKTQKACTVQASSVLSWTLRLNADVIFIFLTANQ